MSKIHTCYTIGLTGGIASGKSAVSNMFENLGCDIVDADIVAREVVTPNSEGLNKVVDAFGNLVLSTDKKLNRAKLREIVFQDSKKLEQLNSILHPIIQKNILSKVKQVKKYYCIVVIPLLCESSSYNWLDRILVVDVKLETQLNRLLKRDSITVELAKKMLYTQCTRKERLSIADDVINNEQSLSQLQKNVESLNRLYKTL